MSDELGPGERELGQSGSADVMIAVADPWGWRVVPGRLHFGSGFLDKVEVEGKEVPCEKGLFGATVTVYVFDRRRREGRRLFGDIKTMRWDDGQLVESQLMVPGVELSAPDWGK
jgi:hypothetical protein